MKAPRKMTNASFAKSIERHKNAIAKHRDALRVLIEDAETIEASCTDAVENLDYAVDILSQYL